LGYDIFKKIIFKGTTTNVFPFHITVLPECEIDHSDDLQEAFKNFNQENSERDTQIIVGENKKIISVHSFFISMRSKKLFQMIKNNPTFELLEENENLFSELIHYAYTGEANISPKEMYDFLQLRFIIFLFIQVSNMDLMEF
jgi:CTP:phosphocholine cytidylyltransferase-like protein